MVNILEREGEREIERERRLVTQHQSTSSQATTAHTLGHAPGVVCENFRINRWQSWAPTNEHHLVILKLHASSSRRRYVHTCFCMLDGVESQVLVTPMNIRALTNSLVSHKRFYKTLCFG